jgi:folate-binding protein YgfZ
MESAHLDDRAVLAVSGPQAREFLQGLITNDVERLSPGTALYTALLTPQGKILFDFFLTEGEGALLIDCARDAAEALHKKLRMYRLRATVEIEPRDQLGVYVNLAGHPPNRVAYADRAVTFVDPRLPMLGMRSIGAIAEMPSDLQGPRAWQALRLAAGVPEAGDFGYEKIFALDAGLDELNAVSFTKGCYIGQELTSRMKHRATTRKRILTITADTALPPPGAALTRGGIEIGEVVAAYGMRGFALMRLDRLEETQGPVTAAQIPVVLVKPVWLA